jgi:hypothetical protein
MAKVLDLVEVSPIALYEMSTRDRRNCTPDLCYYDAYGGRKWTALDEITWEAGQLRPDQPHTFP